MQVLENLRCIQHAPSVQMQEVSSKNVWFHSIFLKEVLILSSMKGSLMFLLSVFVVIFLMCFYLKFHLVLAAQKFWLHIYDLSCANLPSLDYRHSINVNAYDALANNSFFTKQQSGISSLIRFNLIVGSPWFLYTRLWWRWEPRWTDKS